jgi:hypothetical protein
MNSAEQHNYELFSMTGEKNLHEVPDLGIINGKITTGIQFHDVLSFRRLFAPPFAGSDFIFDLRLCGEKVPTDRYTWFPIEVRRWGHVGGLAVESSLVLAAERRALILSFTVENPEKTSRTIPVQFDIRGGLDYTKVWEFSGGVGLKDTKDIVSDHMLVKFNDSGAIVISTDIKSLVWNGYCWHWDAQVSLEAKSKKTFYVIVAMGKKAHAMADVKALMFNPASAIEEARRNFAGKVADIYEKLPTLDASDPRLVQWYNRSLMHLLLNQWNIPEFKLNPYFSTGGINGGCVGSYLWDFGENWEIFNLYNPEALREHVKAFLSIDLTRHYAFMPVDGAGFGPWYYINQEKIIFLIYYYVLHTGDVKFLSEKVNGKSIIDHVIAQALVGDKIHLSANLVDYGAGNHHLELRKQERYDHYLPDMNARRYAYYYAAETLRKLAGKSQTIDLGSRTWEIDFPERAEALKKLITETMWNKKDKWFYWLDAKMNKHLRYTVQMFKLFSSNVLDAEMEAGLLSHLNEKEFLSDYGLHSMAKHDPAYDQIDIDNGGGGICTCFPPQIIEKLYKAGHPDRAEDILKRILWWGEKLAYWSDSIVANNMDYRRDTPLQNAVGSVAAAQSVIFGMFGVAVNPDGSININPAPPSFSSRVALRGLKLRGYNMDIIVEGKNYRIKANGVTCTAKVGQSIKLPPVNMDMKKTHKTHKNKR